MSAGGNRHDPGVRATMRLQLHRDFDFDAARTQVPYFAALGISHLYLSPILRARSGSMHGYDVVDHDQINPELGGEAGLRRLVAALRAQRMGLIVDIVPNHAAVGGHDNARWLEVLEWGRDSRHANFFDIDWDVVDPALHGRVAAPFLGKPYGQALADDELQLAFNTQRGRFHIAYFDHHFPLAPQTYAALLHSGGDVLATLAQRFNAALALRARGARWAAFDAACAVLATASTEPSVRAALDKVLSRYRGTNTPDAAQLPTCNAALHRLIEQQHWRLAWWHTAADEINWRRFFDVIGLAGLRVEENSVFEVVHAQIFRLYAEGLIDGVRIDHVDGLADPRAYCRKLRARLAHLQFERPAALRDRPAYVVAEKILAPGERLARDWGLDGTSGYVFMNEVSAVLHDRDGGEALSTLWRQFSGRSGAFEQAAERARRRIPQELFAADFEACARGLHRLARLSTSTRDWTLSAMRRVLIELLAYFPVYRTYVDARGRSPFDAAIMAQVCNAAQQTCRPAERALVSQINRWLGGERTTVDETALIRRARLRAIARFQQLTPPVAAKSIEDTAFYQYGVLVSRNEVGADPAHFAISVAAFHQSCRARARRFPQAMLATATHDHKRGEDLRARLAVLATMPEQWAALVRQWRARNAVRKPTIDGVTGPDAIDEYILYQMLVGAWPMQLRSGDDAGRAALCARLATWQEKAVREAKRHSGWIEPNLAYEAACRGFLEALLKTQDAFVDELSTFVASIAAAGAVNALSQTVLRLSTPGVPDTYQGCELWDFSLVDPDNRQPVDFAVRAQALSNSLSDDRLLRDWRDGRVKQRLIAHLLALRAELPALFAHGSYQPLAVRGSAAHHLIAFARQHGALRLIVLAPRAPQALLTAPDSLCLAATRWGNTRVNMPPAWRNTRWRNALAGNVCGDDLHVGTLLQGWPLAVLLAH